MAIRLDVAALISLVGNDRLQEELDKNTWYIQVVTVGNYRTPTRVDNITRFKTTLNPIEYLLFNNLDFFETIALRMSDIFDTDKLDGITEIPIDDAEFIWKTIKDTFDRRDMNLLFNQDEYRAIILFDKDLHQVLPYSEDRPSSEFLTKWFPHATVYLV